MVTKNEKATDRLYVFPSDGRKARIRAAQEGCTPAQLFNKLLNDKNS